MSNHKRAKKRLERDFTLLALPALAIIALWNFITRKRKKTK